MNIENKPEELLEFINNNLKFNEKKKNENGEVFTPFSLINEMLDKLPEEVWNDPYLKWLDPAAGIGNFSIIVYTRLMISLKDFFDTEENMKQWILEEMLYFVEYDETNVNKLKEIFCNDKYKLNIFHGSFVSDEKYKKANIPIYSSNIKFDIIMGNPPYNSGAICSNKKREDNNGIKRQTLWPKFVDKSLKLLKEETGYLLFIHPLSWLSKIHIIHTQILEKEVIWLLLWDKTVSKIKFNGKSGEIPISVYLLKNKLNKNKIKTNISSELKGNHYKLNNCSYYLDNSLSIPLGFFSSLLKLQIFTKKNNLYLNYKNDTIKKENLLYHYNATSKKKDLPENYSLEDNYCVDTYTIKDGIKINKSKEKHIDAEKSKLIIAHKSSLNGIFIDDGRLGLCGSHQYYILGDINYLKFIKKIMGFKLIQIVSKFTKYHQEFLHKDIFLFIPDLTKLGYIDIDEKDFYKLLELTQDEINEIQFFNLRN